MHLDHRNIDSTSSARTTQVASQDPGSLSDLEECAGTSILRREYQTRFDRLVSTELPALTRVAYRLCRHRETAEDVVQETLLRAWKHLDQLRDDAKARGWLFMILRRECNRMWGRQRSLVSGEDVSSLADATEVDYTDGIALHRAIDALPENYRTPLVLFAFGEYEVRDIARGLDLCPATVKTRLFRARRKVREQLEPTPPSKFRSGDPQRVETGSRMAGS